ncbi:NAD(P)/FAD-dependent oxidoreductase [Sphingomonas sp.]|jgi:cation diffusion facilitator CzcD-associated flavoprotein CzcO|uniref:flavin-containing monooxygenase n=1 Tax=Sphingomonas sp. TaxID=28214 RepID=UPI002D7E670E|nr:NAD(P)/FAD-dependent oxidoreductase [Sphingomonas sp.]HEU0043682.1 NAD(P)/FAD-dependent oxidoreductase [Sphingomonas sp.]
MAEHLDVIVVGAGISGIGTGYHLQTRCPDRSYAILEAREQMGGTWDLFRYPGIRSDSDMHTLGFSFHPWTQAKAIADGPSIKAYVEETARAYGIDRHIRFGTRVLSANWSTPDARWTVDTDGPEGRKTLTCGFLAMCSGYYSYEKAHAPSFAGAEAFAGRIVHPQFWPQDLDYTGKNVVVIGSGATAVTLVPEMAKDAGQVVMLQRSPTYVVSRPAEDAFANWVRRRLPSKAAYGVTRWKNVLLGMFFYRMTRKKPEQTKQRLLGMVREHLGPDYDIATHFTPRYNPWDQRLCLVPDADLFAAIKQGRAEVVTDTIDRFVPEGIRLTSGRTIPADVIVTATGLELSLMGGVPFTVDGEPVNLADKLQYKGMMFSDVPNLAFTFGYTNASWTLKADLVAKYVCRLLNTMRKRGVRIATPYNDDPAVTTEAFVDFTSGYIQRAAAALPKQGSKKPWKLNQNYALDVMAMRFGSVDDAMRFSNPSLTSVRRVA